MALETAGIIERDIDPADGRRVVYQLTEKGLALAPVLVEMVLWAAKYEATEAPPETVRAMRRSRAAFIAALPTQPMKDVVKPRRRRST